MSSLLVLVFANLYLYPAMILWTVLCIAASPLALLVVLAATRWPLDKAGRFLIWVYGRGWLVLVFPFVRFRRKGFATGLGSQPCIIVVNHLSFFDTFFMAALPFFDVTFAVRSWPFRMPWFAPFMRLAGYLDVEALSGPEMLDRATAILTRGGRILFFPEGHRSRDGRLHEFQSGAFRLATHSGVPIVLLAITGTDDFLSPGRWWLAPARVNLVALPSLAPGSMTSTQSFRQLRGLAWERMNQAITTMARDRVGGRHAGCDSEGGLCGIFTKMRCTGVRRVSKLATDSESGSTQGGG